MQEKLPSAAFLITLISVSFLYINQIQICISIKRQKGMTLIRHAFSIPILFESAH